MSRDGDNEDEDNEDAKIGEREKEREKEKENCQLVRDVGMKEVQLDGMTEIGDTKTRETARKEN